MTTPTEAAFLKELDKKLWTTATSQWQNDHTPDPGRLLRAMQRLPLLLAVLFSLLHAEAYAFKRKHHGVISRQTFDLLNCAGSAHVDHRYVDAFAGGSMFEDNWWRIPWKGFRQHFHRPGWKPAHKRNTFLPRYRRLQARLERALDHKRKHRAWRTAGKLAHYLQDMTCPPHVAPVYHGSKDAFDLAPAEYFPTLDPALVEAWSSIDPRILLDTVSLRTFYTITDPLRVKVDDEIVGGSWSLFWSLPQDDKGFGSYGEVGNTWRRERITTPTHTYEILARDYEYYYAARWRGACTATAALIMQVQRRLAP